jgi:dienelactone hydrolase
MTKDNSKRQAGHPSSDSMPVISMAPVTLTAPDRGLDLQLRVSAPLTGDRLPVIVFSHGNGQSLYGYGPLANHWAAHGFVVIQPTHLDSRMIGLAQDDPRRPQLWRFRESDLVSILDGLDSINSAVPAIAGRMDRDHIAVAGHSWGGQTAGTLLGAKHPDPDDGSVVDIKDSRIKAGVLLAVPGTGGANLSPSAAENFPFMHADYAGMTTPALIVAGDNDHGAMTVRGPDWWREAYDYSSGPKALFTAFGGEHSLGGIPNYEARETTDERPQRVAAIQRLSTAYLRRILLSDEAGWDVEVSKINDAAGPEGSIEQRDA